MTQATSQVNGIEENIHYVVTGRQSYSAVEPSLASLQAKQFTDWCGEDADLVYVDDSRVGELAGTEV